MSYTIGEFPVNEFRADDYLLALGRALHIATEFEHKSRELVILLRGLEGLGPMFTEVTDLDELFSLARTPPPLPDDQAIEQSRLKEAAIRAKTTKQPLAHVLERLYDEVYDDPHGLDKLRDARVGRNWIAHNAGHVFLPGRTWTDGHFLRSFRNAVIMVAYADALVSAMTWNEPENWHSVGPPEGYTKVYPELVVTWVFEKIWDLLPTDDLPPWQPPPGGPHRRLEEYMDNTF